MAKQEHEKGKGLFDPIDEWLDGFKGKKVKNITLLRGEYSINPVTRETEYRMCFSSIEFEDDTHIWSEKNGLILCPLPNGAVRDPRKEEEPS